MNRGGRSMLALEECGVAYELKDISLENGEHKKPEYLKLNPNGTVPTLVDGDTIVWESMAINAYLADKYGKGLMPATAAERAHALQWSFWGITAVEPALSTLFEQRISLPEAERDTNVAAEAEAKAKAGFAILDHALEGRKYLVGDSFTLADLNVGHLVAWAALVGVDLSQLAQVSRWFGELSARPSFAKMLGGVAK
jgi:glutathione S-transferase